MSEPKTDESVMKSVKDVAVPKKEDGSISWKKLTTTWTRVLWVVGVLTTVGGGFTMVSVKIAEIQQRGIDISDLKDSNRAITAEQAAINARISESVNNARTKIITEFNTRDGVDRELDARIDAVLRELRARHGVITLADEAGGTQRSRVRAASAATDTVHVAPPTADPMAGVDGL